MVDIHKVMSHGNWEALYINGELVEENHLGRVNIEDHLAEGMTIDHIESGFVQIPDDMYGYPDTLAELCADDRYDFDDPEYGDGG